MEPAVVGVIYLLAAVCFILGLKGLSHPRTAVRANLLGAFGMLLAVVATLLTEGVVDLGIILAGFVVGGALGWVVALRIKMTAMPQLVALFNGFGGGASALVAGVELMKPDSPWEASLTLPAGLSGLIGAVTLTGSVTAFAKLQELVTGRPVLFSGQKPLNLLLLLLCVALCTWMVLAPDAMPFTQESAGLFWAVVVLASVLGVLLVIPIGGADMPVVISLLNSYSGLAAAATGFAIQKPILIITGSLVGSSGIILTKIMCKAMNRSLANVLFGGVGVEVTGASADDIYAGKVKATSAEEIALLLESARRVMVVPGYGMAVAQAQHAVRDLAAQLEARGVTVEYAIHPVAGRMPGHMNVLLAEANIPYEKLKEMDQANPAFPETDLVLVLGANDVVNPVARTDPSSPIAGMPILDVDKARTVVVVKRSLSPGFAGIPNPLFVADNALMFFADGKQAVIEILNALKAA